MKLVELAAVARNGVIGQAGRLPWRLKSDLAHFRSQTMGKPVVMGRKTFLSIGKPLAGRTNIVVSRDPSFTAAGAIVTGSVDAALLTARGDALRRCVDEIVVIGGAELYRQTLPAADRLVITQVDLDPQGDVTFPDIDWRLWKEVSRSDQPAGPGDEASFTLLVYERSGT
ncbi:MAG: dihydrofolate reductase [Alphaproteobacteria bacterium]|nr:MAG: dihydrofolate reductase [Alphaproteobacteria bacterium]